jgi:hypothetical protein
VQVEALRKNAIEERLRHEEERARCREYQRLYSILHEQVTVVTSTSFEKLGLILVLHITDGRIEFKN